jgi:two-component system, NtrC family, sensor histidine kinase KinB
MKLSIRTKFGLGMIFIFIIILILSVFSAYYMNKLSTKTGAILKENYLSVVYARDMTEGIIMINNEIEKSFLGSKCADSMLINTKLLAISSALELEKKDITENGEQELVSVIEKDYSGFKDLVAGSLPLLLTSEQLYGIQKMSEDLMQQLGLLSRMNGNAIEDKTDDAKLASKNAMTQMTILATTCFLVAISFLYSFSSYFSRRFFQLFNGINEIVSSNYDQRLFFEGKDEFYEISIVFNEMAEKLKKNMQEMSVHLHTEVEKDLNDDEINELKLTISRIKSIEEQAINLISRLEQKQK